MAAHLFAGDSIPAHFAAWCLTVVAAHSGTYVQLGNVDVASSPAYSGSTLMQFPSGSYGPNLVDNFTARVGTYCTSSTWLYFCVGINDLYAMGTNTALISGAIADLESWRSAWGSMNTAINALAGNKPAKVIVIGLPYPSGSGLTVSALPAWMRAHWQTARTFMDRVTKDACARFGWVYVPLNTFIPDYLFDTKHPNTVGQTYMANQVLAAGG